uniref:leukocyte elastase inhibitor-like isoform X2 n=1 Tax=Pristiophorus japonicus TaxID=55135 RepID=UPI00398F44DD
MEDLSKANCHFTLDLFRKLVEKNQAGNIFFSPFSISSALAMVYLGAKNNTASQMAKALHFDQVGDLHSGFQKMQSAINRADVSYLLKVANQLYGEKTYNFLEEFCKSSKKYYGSGMSGVDFRSAADETRQVINKWVEAQTEGKIQNLLAQGSVDSNTRLVLVNAIYFKGTWAEKFNQQATKEMPFRLNKLEQELTLEKLQEWTLQNRMRKMDVQVRLPKFKLEDDYELNSLLSSLGMRDLFNESSADLSGMSETHDLFVSKVIHKSFVQVTEEGTEAAAATAVMIACGARREMQHEVEIFTADHPFLFFIRHNKTNSILFFGRYTSP